MDSGDNSQPKRVSLFSPGMLAKRRKKQKKKRKKEEMTDESEGLEAFPAIKTKKMEPHTSDDSSAGKKRGNLDQVVANSSRNDRSSSISSRLERAQRRRKERKKRSVSLSERVVSGLYNPFLPKVKEPETVDPEDIRTGETLKTLLNSTLKHAVQKEHEEHIETTARISDLLEDLTMSLTLQERSDIGDGEEDLSGHAPGNPVSESPNDEERSGVGGDLSEHETDLSIKSVKSEAEADEHEISLEIESDSEDSSDGEDEDESGDETEEEEDQIDGSSDEEEFVRVSPKVNVAVVDESSSGEYESSSGEEESGEESSSEEEDEVPIPTNSILSKSISAKEEEEESSSSGSEYETETSDEEEEEELVKVTTRPAAVQRAAKAVQSSSSEYETATDSESEESDDTGDNEIVIAISSGESSEEESSSEEEEKQVSVSGSVKIRKPARQESSSSEEESDDVEEETSNVLDLPFAPGTEPLLPQEVVVIEAESSEDEEDEDIEIEIDSDEEDEYSSDSSEEEEGESELSLGEMISKVHLLKRYGDVNFQKSLDLTRRQSAAEVYNTRIEALNFYSRALGFLEKLPQGPTRITIAAAVRLGVAKVHEVLENWGEVVQECSRALELVNLLGGNDKNDMKGQCYLKRCVAYEKMYMLRSCRNDLEKVENNPKFELRCGQIRQRVDRAERGEKIELPGDMVQTGAVELEDVAFSDTTSMMNTDSSAREDLFFDEEEMQMLMEEELKMEEEQGTLDKLMESVEKMRADALKSVDGPRNETYEDDEEEEEERRPTTVDDFRRLIEVANRQARHESGSSEEEDDIELMSKEEEGARIAAEEEERKESAKRVKRELRELAVKLKEPVTTTSYMEKNIEYSKWIDSCMVITGLTFTVIVLVVIAVVTAGFVYGVQFSSPGQSGRPEARWVVLGVSLVSFVSLPCFILLSFGVFCFQNCKMCFVKRGEKGKNNNFDSTNASLQKTNSKVTLEDYLSVLLSLIFSPKYVLVLLAFKFSFPGLSVLQYNWTYLFLPTYLFLFFTMFLTVLKFIWSSFGVHKYVLISEIMRGLLIVALIWAYCLILGGLTVMAGFSLDGIFDGIEGETKNIPHVATLLPVCALALLYPMVALLVRYCCRIKRTKGNPCKSWRDVATVFVFLGCFFGLVFSIALCLHLDKFFVGFQHLNNFYIFIPFWLLLLAFVLACFSLIIHAAMRCCFCTSKLRALEETVNKELCLECFTSAQQEEDETKEKEVTDVSSYFFSIRNIQMDDSEFDEYCGILKLGLWSYLRSYLGSRRKFEIPELKPKRMNKRLKDRWKYAEEILFHVGSVHEQRKLMVVLFLRGLVYRIVQFSTYHIRLFILLENFLEHSLYSCEPLRKFIVEDPDEALSKLDEFHAVFRQIFQPFVDVQYVRCYLCSEIVKIHGEESEIDCVNCHPNAGNFERRPKHPDEELKFRNDFFYKVLCERVILRTLMPHHSMFSRIKKQKLEPRREGEEVVRPYICMPHREIAYFRKSLLRPINKDYMKLHKIKSTEIVGRNLPFTPSLFDFYLYNCNKAIEDVELIFLFKMQFQNSLKSIAKQNLSSTRLNKTGKNYYSFQKNIISASKVLKFLQLMRDYLQKHCQMPQTAQLIFRSCFRDFMKEKNAIKFFSCLNWKSELIVFILKSLPKNDKFGLHALRSQIDNKLRKILRETRESAKPERFIKFLLLIEKVMVEKSDLPRDAYFKIVQEILEHFYDGFLKQLPFSWGFWNFFITHTTNPEIKSNIARLLEAQVWNKLKKCNLKTFVVFYNQLSSFVKQNRMPFARFKKFFQQHFDATMRQKPQFLDCIFALKYQTPIKFKFKQMVQNCLDKKEIMGKDDSFMLSKIRVITGVQLRKCTSYSQIFKLYSKMHEVATFLRKVRNRDFNDMFRGEMLKVGCRADLIDEEAVRFYVRKVDDFENDLLDFWSILKCFNSKAVWEACSKVMFGIFDGMKLTFQEEEKWFQKIIEFNDRCREYTAVFVNGESKEKVPVMKKITTNYLIERLDMKNRIVSIRKEFKKIRKEIMRMEKESFVKFFPDMKKLRKNLKKKVNKLEKMNVYVSKNAFNEGRKEYVLWMKLFSGKKRRSLIKYKTLTRKVKMKLLGLNSKFKILLRIVTSFNNARGELKREIQRFKELEDDYDEGLFEEVEKMISKFGVCKRDLGQGALFKLNKELREFASRCRKTCKRAISQLSEILRATSRSSLFLETNSFLSMEEDGNQVYPTPHCGVDNFPVYRICVFCLTFNQRVDRHCKHTTCIRCGERFCQLCLRANLTRNYRGWLCGGADTGYKAPCTPILFHEDVQDESRNNPCVFPIQSVDNARYWYIGGGTYDEENLPDPKPDDMNILDEVIRKYHELKGKRQSLEKHVGEEERKRKEEPVIVQVDPDAEDDDSDDDFLAGGADHEDDFDF